MTCDAGHRHRRPSVRSTAARLFHDKNFTSSLKDFLSVREKIRHAEDFINNDPGPGHHRSVIKELRVFKFGVGIVSPLMFLARRPTAFIYALLPGPWAGHPLAVRFSLHPQGFAVSSASGRSHRLRIIALTRGRSVSVPLPRLSPYALESICASSWWGDFPHPTGRRPSLLSRELKDFQPAYVVSQV